MPTFDARHLATDALTERLERGHVAVLEGEAFELLAAERRFLSPVWSRGGAKNIALRAGERVARGANAGVDDAAALGAMLARYAKASEDLVDRLLPDYRGGRSLGSTSFRPAPIGGRALSWRSDDTRLHVDSFPSNPVRGRRILRVFTNVNPDGMTRDWLLGEPFEDFAARFFPRARAPMPGAARLLRALGITKALRSDYDHYMLQLHDLAKGDADYQRDAPRDAPAFAPGTTWIALTDQVLHAATRGQHAFEQTFYVDVDRMREPRFAPLAVLERLAGRALA